VWYFKEKYKNGPLDARRMTPHHHNERSRNHATRGRKNIKVAGRREEERGKFTYEEKGGKR